MILIVGGFHLGIPIFRHECTATFTRPPNPISNGNGNADPQSPSLKLLVNTIDTNLADPHMASHLALPLDSLVQRGPIRSSSSSSLDGVIIASDPRGPAMAMRACSPSHFPVLLSMADASADRSDPTYYCNTSVNNNGVLFEKHVLAIPSIHTIT